jgi:hypothetical protein
LPPWRDIIALSLVDGSIAWSRTAESDTIHAGSGTFLDWSDEQWTIVDTSTGRELLTSDPVVGGAPQVYGDRLVVILDEGGDGSAMDILDGSEGRLLARVPEGTRVVEVTDQLLITTDGAGLSAFLVPPAS